MSANQLMANILYTEIKQAIAKDRLNDDGHLQALCRKTVQDFSTASVEAAAYKWAYGYLQDRMTGLGREGWAHDCDDEIKARIEAGRA